MSFYTLDPPATDSMYRCRNTHTLAPLYVHRLNGVLITEPQPIDSVPLAHFWRNSEGYGFDLRNLAVLLRTNFRNLNPHTVMESPPRPLWCNKHDLASLIDSLPLDTRDLIRRRINVLNSLSDDVKRRLAVLACELCSFTYDNLYAWLFYIPNDVLAGMGMTASKTAILQEIFLLSHQRRETAILGILQETGSQANQHLAEPAGVNRDSDLYRLMENYKADAVRDFIAYLSDFKRTRDEKIVELDESISAYMETQFHAICRRYTQVLTKKPRHHSKMLLWHWVFKRTIPAYAAPLPSRRVGLRASIRIIPQHFEIVHIRVFYDLGNDVYIIDDDPDSILVTSTDELWRYINTSTKIKNSELQMAALAGGLHDVCLGNSWKKTLRNDYNFIRMLAIFTTFPETPLRHFDASIAQCEPAVKFKQMFGCFSKMPTGLRSILVDFGLHIDRTYSDISINKIVMEGGYDNGSGTLLSKLHGALEGTTCAQDIGSELCEFLSVPHPPECPEFAQFQVDHTGVPPLMEFPDER